MNVVEFRLTSLRQFSAILCVIILARTSANADESRDAMMFLSSYCVDCHQGEDAESGFRLDRVGSEFDLRGEVKEWKIVLGRVRDHTMPPQDSDEPTPSEREAFVEFLRNRMIAAIAETGPQPGPARLRRLNRTEYANTVRDLLGIHVSVGHALPADGAGGEGFDNASETLFISPIYAEKYMEAADSALRHALRDPDSRNQILHVRPTDDRLPHDAARFVLERFLPRAFRRPVSKQEVDDYVWLFQKAFDEDPSYENAVRFALQAAMVSPKFLMLFEEANETNEPVLITQHEMASRLSYFLWNSMPDDELMRLANDGKLHDPEVLQEQVARMLFSRIDRRGLRRSAKVRDFAENFVEQWLGTRALGREFKPDPSVVPRYSSELEGGLKYEPVFFFEEIFAENRSLLNFIDSDFTYANRAVARHYRIRGEFREQPKRVDLKPEHHRGGLLTMGAVLAISSHPYRTSPVLRGKWILETMLGTPPPPPPPDVPTLEESGEEDESASLRDKLKIHRSAAACATCHRMIDPLGFGLDNYDIVGQWRTKHQGTEIDASGELPDGTRFEGPEQLKEQLMKRKDQFIRHFTAKTLGYALSRGLTEQDDYVVEQVATVLAENDYKSQTLISEIVKSVPFRYKSPAVNPVPTSNAESSIQATSEATERGFER
ncbi:MAG: DUF1592 domain-containing protein [Planctomycetota bacterium]